MTSILPCPKCDVTENIESMFVDFGWRIRCTACDAFSEDVGVLYTGFAVWAFMEADAIFVWNELVEKETAHKVRACVQS